MTQNPVAISSVSLFNGIWGLARALTIHQSTLNIEPVIPITINEDLEPHHTAATFPAASWREVPDNHVAGIGDTTFDGIPLTGQGQGLIWVFGPAFLFPTASSADLGDGKLGPRAFR